MVFQSFHTICKTKKTNDCARIKKKTQLCDHVSTVINTMLKNRSQIKNTKPKKQQTLKTNKIMQIILDIEPSFSTM